MITRNIAVVLSGRDAGLARTLGAAAGSLHAFDTTVRGANSRTKALAAGLKLAFIAIAAAAAVGLGAAVNAAIDFEQAMRNVNTVAHETEPGLRNMSNAVLEMTTRLPQNAKTLSDGLRDIAGSGFYGADALQILEVSARAASAGMTDTQTAARTIVAVLQAYGLEASDAADVSDVLFSTVEYGVITFEELAMSMGEVVAGAAVAGVEIDEVGAAIATMTLSGLQATEATTSLNRLIRELINPSDALAETYRKLGYESGESALEQDGLYGVMEKLRIATGGQITKLQELFPEIRSSRGAFALMTAGGQQYARVQALITEETSRAGATQRAFNEQMKGLSNQWKVFTNQLTVVGIKLGTALIPALRSTLQWAQQVGPKVGQAISSMWNTAFPAFRAVGDAIVSVVDLFKTLWAAISPVVRVAATLTFGVAIGSLMALANALEFVANFLTDHPALVQAVAAAYGSVLVGRVLAAASAFIRARVAALAFAGATKAMAAGAVIGVLIERLRMAATAAQQLAIAFQLKSLGQAKAAIGGLSGVVAGLGTALAGAAVVGGLWALQNAFDNSRKSADKFVDSITSGFDQETFSGLSNSVERLHVEARKLDEDWNNMLFTGNDLTAGIRGMVEAYSPLENKVLDNLAANKALWNEIEESEPILAKWDHDLNTVANTLGLTRDETQKWLDEIDYDPSDFTVFAGDLADKIRMVRLESQNATPAASAFSDAVETMQDPTTSAADRVGALEDAIDSLINTVKGVYDATTAWHQAMADMDAQVAENGFTLDLTTQEGRDMREMMSEAADAAVDMANAVAQESGSVSAGVDALALHREALINQVQSYGVSREAAEEYVNQLGLTPEAIETLIELKGAEGAMFKGEQLQKMFDIVNGLEANPEVNIDTADFDDDAAKIGIVLAQIGLENPEATVTLNDKPFKATAAQVELWSTMFGDSTPEARALLNIIDPENKFTTLSEAAANWGSQKPTATADVNTGPAEAGIQSAWERLWGWDAAHGTATVDGDESPANDSINNAWNRLFGWDAGRGTADVNANRSQSDRTLNSAWSRLFAWDRDSGTADVNANDNASGELSTVNGLLNAIDGRIVTATVRINNISSGLSRSQQERIAMGVAPRWGNIVSYARGGIQAHIGSGNLIRYAEPETGGEAFIPRLGDPARSKQILQHAARWYGMEIRPAGAMRGGGEVIANTTVNVVIRPRGAIANTDELLKLTRKEIGSALETHDKRLAQALGAR